MGSLGIGNKEPKLLEPGKDDELALQGQAHIWNYLYNFAESMALKCAIELGIADIINQHGRPISLSQLATGIASPPPDTDRIRRVMQLLVRKGIFTACSNYSKGGGDTLYGLTPSSQWLLRDAELSLAPLVLTATHPSLMASWQGLSWCVRDGGFAFEASHGVDLWGLARQNPKFNKTFNEGMACTARITMKAVLANYKDGFDNVQTLVDVGEGTGTAVTEIVKVHPHVRGINYDAVTEIVTERELRFQYSGDCFCCMIEFLQIL